VCTGSPHFKPQEGKELSEQNEKEARKLAIELMEKEIVYIKGRRRQEAMRRYRRLLSSLAEEPIYFVRS